MLYGCVQFSRTFMPIRLLTKQISRKFSQDFPQITKGQHDSRKFSSPQNFNEFVKLSKCKAEQRNFLRHDKTLTCMKSCTNEMKPRCRRCIPMNGIHVRQRPLHMHSGNRSHSQFSFIQREVNEQPLIEETKLNKSEYYKKRK